MKYEYFEHTADAKFKAYGKNLEETFANAALALANIITEVEKIEPKTEKKIEVKTNDMKSLLYDFLEQFLYLLDAEQFLLSKVKEIKIDRKNFSLSATVLGDKVSDRYVQKTHVKAMTYAEMEIKETEVTVVVDL